MTPSDPSSESGYSLADLLRVMERLRDPDNGCPWDLQQTFTSIVPSTLEECYELAASIEGSDWPHVADELGDLLFQVVFYAQLGREQELFDLASVVHGLTAKLLRRHPHVFANGEIEGVVAGETDTDHVKQEWERIKAQERAARQQHGALDDIPLALPALPRAQKLQKRASRVGFDWEQASGVLDKLEEEIGELREAIAAAGSAGKPSQDVRDAQEEELGDLLFCVVNLARHLGLDAETALRGANRKFERRFELMERELSALGRTFADLDSAALERLWDTAKRELRHAP